MYIVASRLITSNINKHGGYRPYRKLAGRLAHLTRKDGETAFSFDVGNDCSLRMGTGRRFPQFLYRCTAHVTK